MPLHFGINPSHKTPCYGLCYSFSRRLPLIEGSAFDRLRLRALVSNGITMYLHPTK
jgi:hypothetical protein